MIGLGGLIGRTTGDARVGVRRPREELAVLSGDVTSVAGRREVDDVGMLNTNGLRYPSGLSEGHLECFEDLRGTGVVRESIPDLVEPAKACQFVSVAVDLLCSLKTTDAPRVTVRVLGV